MVRSKRRKPQSRQNELIGVRVCIPAREFGEEWARQTHGDAWNSTSYSGEVLRVVRLTTGGQEAIIRFDSPGAVVEEWSATVETVVRYRVVERLEEGEAVRAPPDGERGAEVEVGGFVGEGTSPSEVSPEEAFLDVQECTTLHEEGLDPVEDGVEANGSVGNEFGVVWSEENGEVAVDPRAESGTTTRLRGHASPSSYLPEPFRETEALQFFLRFFPFELLTDWAKEITRRGRSKYNRPGDTFLSYDRDCTPGMMLRVFGCFVYMLLFPGQSRKSFWEVVDVEKDPLAVQFCLSKYISRRDFFRILEFLADSVPKYTGERRAREDRPEQVGACKGPRGTMHTLQGDPHWELRRFWDAWNVHATKHYTPSWLVVVDESMLKWMGRHMPSRMFLRRKPDPLGRELKTVCDGLTGVCFRMEPVENAELMKGKQFYSDFGTTTATTLRLMEPLFGSGRVCLGDSWFGSVKTCCALLDRGLFSVLNVKTAHRGFPRATLERLLASDPHQRGLTVCVPGEVHAGRTRRKIKATAHRGPAGVPLCLVSSCFTTQPAGTLKYMVKHPTDTTHLLAKEIPVDETSQVYRSRYGIVDQHNRLRTGSVAFHDVWKTRDFRIRELSELIGLAEVNTFLLMRAKGPGHVRQKYCRKVLAKELLENAWIMADLEMERQQALRLRPLLAAMAGDEGGIGHRLVSLEEVMKHSGEGTGTKKIVQRRCVMCGKKASAACLLCHRPSEGTVAYLCGPYTGRECAAQHMAGIPSRRRRRVSGEDVQTLPTARTRRRPRHSLA